MVVLGGKPDNEGAAAVEERLGRDDHGTDMLLGEIGKGLFDLLIVGGIENPHIDRKGPGGFLHVLHLKPSARIGRIGQICNRR